MKGAGPGGQPPWNTRGGTRVADSALYGHLWGTAEARAILGEEGRLAGWLEVLAALARAQAAAGLIPAHAAALIAEHARPELIDVGYAAEQTRLASHSMLGLIRALQAALPADVGEYVYVGATVQDITDTATSLALRGIGSLAWRDLRRIEELLLDLAARHRSTAMPGRTHGQAEQQFLDPPQVPPGERADAAQRQRGGGVGDVLHGRTDVDVLAGVGRQRSLQRPNQAEHGVRGQPGLLGRVPHIDQFGAGVHGDARGRAAPGGNLPEPPR